MNNNDKQSRFISIKVKLIFITVAIIVFVVSSISMAIYTKTSKQIYESYVEESDSKIEAISTEIQVIREKIENLADNLIALGVLNEGPNNTETPQINKNLEIMQGLYLSSEIGTKMLLKMDPL